MGRVSRKGPPRGPVGLGRQADWGGVSEVGLTGLGRLGEEGRRTRDSGWGRVIWRPGRGGRQGRVALVLVHPGQRAKAGRRR